MTSSRRPAPLPDLVLYGKPGCHLCDDARAILAELLTARAAAGLPAPTIVERDITRDEDWFDEYWETIPVLELGDRQLPLAIRPNAIRAFLRDSLDGKAAEAASPDRSEAAQPR